MNVETNVTPVSVSEPIVMPFFIISKRLAASLWHYENLRRKE